MESFILSILGIDNIFDENHMCKPEVCSVYEAIKYSKTWNI